MLTNGRQSYSEHCLLDVNEAAGTELGSACLQDNYESPKSLL